MPKQQESPIKRAASPWTTAIVNVAILGIGLILLELIFGSWLTRNEIQKLNIPKNVDLNFYTAHLYPSTTPYARYRRDRYGLRGRYQDPSKIDILTLGGSATDQRYISEGFTWQDVLRANFKKAGRDLAVVNAGVDGQSTYGHIKNFEWWFPWIPGFKSQYILIYLGPNDLFADKKSPNDDLAGKNRFKSIIKSKSALYHLYETLRGTYLASRVFKISHRKIDFPSLAWTQYPLQKNHKNLLKERLIAFEERLDILLDQINKWGGCAIVVTQPSRIYKKTGETVSGVSQELFIDNQPINGVDCFFALSLLHQKSMGLCRERNGICLDLANELDLENADFYDYFHPTPTGAKKIGDYLFNKLKKRI